MDGEAYQQLDTEPNLSRAINEDPSEEEIDASDAEEDALFKETQAAIDALFTMDSEELWALDDPNDILSRSDLKKFSTICHHCNGIFADPRDREIFLSGSGFSWERTRSDIKKGDSSGCSLCHLLASSLWLRDNVLLKVCRTVTTSGPIISLGISYDTRAVNLEVAAFPDDPAASFIGRTPINRSVGSPETFSRARDWISECDNQHKNCPKLESVILPTRLIDVSVPGKPFLYVSGLEETGAYASLSYCWGGPQPFKTTLENIEEYQKILPESELPQTIRDAITASHQLGFQFLWIDSLCIIQNSSTDVEKEIARMQEIYKNSAVTIAAANADKCSDGFLYERPSSSLEFCIPFPCGEDGQGAVFLRDWDVGKWREPLSERAWTFQEMTLSPRVLIYGAKQLYWRCPTAFYADGGDMTWDNYCDRTSTSTLQSTWTFFKENLRPKEPSYSLTDGKRRRSWINIVNDYTRRKLSVQDDKLLALSGIATEFHNSFGWSYLAGLWKESLTDDLMWRRAKPDPDLHPLSYRAPSWSWVSCYGAISYDDPNEAFYDGHVKRSYVMARRVVAEIISCQTSLFSTDVPFGRVIDGKLTLRAPLKHAEMECLTDYIGSLVGSGSTASTNMGNAERPSVGHVWLDGPKGVNKEQQSPISQDKKRSSSPVFCLIVQFKGKSDTEMFAQGLVLKQVSAEDDSQGQLYRRVGLFECSDSVEEAFFENCPEHTVVII